jgi:multisubunit Na+/H+ antiporter MnhB subunit
MTEIYLRLVDRILTPILLLIAIFLFLRGHDLPGGGFIAGLVAAAAIELTILALGSHPRPLRALACSPAWYRLDGRSDGCVDRDGRRRFFLGKMDPV